MSPMSLQHKNENMVELFFCNWWYFVGLQDLCKKKKKGPTYKETTWPSI